MLLIDYETRSKLNLKKVGAVKYAKHPSTGIICLGYKINNDRPKIWYPRSEAIPSDLLHALKTEKEIWAHNAFFEYCITTFVLPKYIKNFTPPKLEYYNCTSALCSFHGLPRKLEEAAMALNLDYKKDMEGHRLMLKYTKPTKKGKWFCNEDDIKRIGQYCLTDILVENELLKKLKFRLSDFEKRVWVNNQQMNLRGVRVDLEMVEKIIKFSAHLNIKMQDEICYLTDYGASSATQTKKILEWFHSEGLDIPNLRAQTIVDILKTPIPNPKVKRVLEIRKQMSLSSVKKYNAILTRADESRVKDLTIYWGASTGREAGQGVQIQNLVKAKIKNVKLCSEILNQSDTLENFETFYDEPNVAFSSLVRSAFIATPGYEMFSGDFNAIECRLAHWFSGNEEKLKLFREGADLYKILAAKLYSKEIKDVTDDERWLAKQVELGCIGEGELVFTNKGLVPIEKITKEHLLWDGENFVKHAGVLSKGLKETVNMFGVWLTEDHQVLCGKKWCQSVDILQDKNILYSVLVTGKENLKLRAILSVAKQIPQKPYLLSVIVGLLNLWLINIILSLGKQLGAAFVLTIKESKSLKNLKSIKRLCQILLIAHDFLIDFLVLFQGATTKTQSNFHGTVKEVLKFIPFGEKIEQNFLNTFKKLRDGIIQNLKWTELMLIKVINLVTCDSFQRLTIREIEETSTSYKKKILTYDILLSGSKNRFMILSKKGPIVVHNCQYGLGHKKFVQMCLSYGREISLDLAKKAIELYREVNYKVVDTWKALERDAILAVRNPGTKIQSKKVVFLFEQNILFCTLPSGRRLPFYGAEIRVEETPWNQDVERLYYWRVDSKTKKWSFLSTYGGSILESICQGTARDIAVNSVFNLQRLGVHYLFGVHDEIVCEAKKNTLSLDQFLKTMVELPTWCGDFPIKAGGWVDDRYKKE